MCLLLKKLKALFGLPNIYLYTMEYYSAIKKNEILPFAATWMDLEIIILSEVSQKGKNKYRMLTHTYGT